MKAFLVPVVLCLFVAPRDSAADAFSINVLNATHTVALTTRTYDGVTTAHNPVTGASPVSDLVTFPGHQRPGDDFAMASADLFAVTAGTETEHFSDIGRASATATTDVLFQPVISGTAAITVTSLLGGSARFYTSSYVRLMDLTTGQDLWNVGWDYFWGTLTAIALTSAPTTVPTTFDSSHLYQLSLSGYASSSMDSQSVTTTVAGLQTVPEPATLLLVAMGAGGAMLTRRRRHP